LPEDLNILLPPQVTESQIVAQALDPSIWSLRCPGERVDGLADLLNPTIEFASVFREIYPPLFAVSPNSQNRM
jgi:hypothetical protein